MTTWDRYFDETDDERTMSTPQDDWDYDDNACECELDYNCGRHAYTETPEDRMATEWSQNHP